MLSFADGRTFGGSDERFSHCLFCGRDLVLLPEDRRGGLCFDCLTLSVPQPTICPNCGATIAGEDRATGCAQCRWYPLRE